MELEHSTPIRKKNSDRKKTELFFKFYKVLFKRTKNTALLNILVFFRKSIYLFIYTVIELFEMNQNLPMSVLLAPSPSLRTLLFVKP